MLAAIGAIFGSTRIYMYLAIGAVVAVIGIYVLVLRDQKAEAVAALATTQATVSIQRSALATDGKALADLQKARQADQAALNGAQHDVSNVQERLRAAEDAINAIPKSKTCQGLDARDRATIDGVQRIINPGPSAANPNGGSAASGKSP